MHFPSELIRASTRLRELGHFFRNFPRLAEVGLLWIRTWPGISSRRPVEEQASNERSKGSELSRCSAPNGEIFSKSAWKISDRPKNENIIISIHIPKTGGTTFVDILRKCAEEVLYLDYDYEGPSPEALFRHGKRLTAPPESIISDLGSFPGRSVIHGHFPASKYIHRFPNAVYVTWLRDPVERVVSNYLYWQRSRMPGDHRWEQVTSQKLSLEQFAQLDLARNLQQAYLFPLTVERFNFIGITEEYDRSLELFRRLFCPETPFEATIRNRNPSRQGEFYDLEPELRKKILKLNERDAHAYLDGSRRFRYLCKQVGL